MYSDPLMVLREYVQNAADSIDLAVQIGDLSLKSARINITLDGSSRKLIIADNGVGIPQAQAVEVLYAVAASTKRQDTTRDFRGIGRLGGVGYCDVVKFEMCGERRTECKYSCVARRSTEIAPG